MESDEDVDEEHRQLLPSIPFEVKSLQIHLAPADMKRMNTATTDTTSSRPEKRAPSPPPAKM
ncbi:MAG: hypothetical protein ACLR6W_12005 [Evtepia sp.]